jgi:hypothetical protein
MASSYRSRSKLCTAEVAVVTLAISLMNNAQVAAGAAHNSLHVVPIELSFEYLDQFRGWWGAVAAV